MTPVNDAGTGRGEAIGLFGVTVAILGAGLYNSGNVYEVEYVANADKSKLSFENRMI